MDAPPERNIEMERDFARCRFKMYSYPYVVEDRDMRFLFVHQCMVADGWVMHDLCMRIGAQGLAHCYVRKLPSSSPCDRP